MKRERRQEKKSDKNNILLVIGLLLLVAIIGIGYAALNQTLNITGTANIGTSTWDVHFENYSSRTASNVVPTTAPSTTGSPTTLSYIVNLNVPGDVYEFQVDVKNAGTLPATLSSVSKAGAESYNFIVYTVKMVSGSNLVDVPTNLTIAANSSVTLVVRVEYSRDLVDESTVGTSIPALNLTYQMDFVQG